MVVNRSNSFPKSVRQFWKLRQVHTTTHITASSPSALSPLSASPLTNPARRAWHPGRRLRTDQAPTHPVSLSRPNITPPDLPAVCLPPSSRLAPSLLSVGAHGTKPVELVPALGGAQVHAAERAEEDLLVLRAFIILGLAIGRPRLAGVNPFEFAPLAVSFVHFLALRAAPNRIPTYVPASRSRQRVRPSLQSVCSVLRGPW